MTNKLHEEQAIKCIISKEENVKKIVYKKDWEELSDSVRNKIILNTNTIYFNDAGSRMEKTEAMKALKDWGLFNR